MNKNPEQLIDEVKRADEKYRKLMRNMTILYVVMIPLYFGLFVLNPDPELVIADRIMGASLGLGFTLFAVYFYWYKKQYEKPDLTEPLITVISKAEKRYRLITPVIALLIIGLVLIGIGVVSSMSAHMPESWSQTKSIFVPAIAFTLLNVLAWIIGVIRWRRQDRPLWIKLQNALKDAEE